jgi:hypothetical protein
MWGLFSNAADRRSGNTGMINVDAVAQTGAAASVTNAGDITATGGTPSITGSLSDHRPAVVAA